MAHSRSDIGVGPLTYPQLRRAVFDQWRGPASLELRQEGHVGFWGWPTLALDVRVGFQPKLEARLVYANLFDAAQNHALIWAVQWDADATVRRLRHQPEADLERSLPTRIVIIPAAYVRAWTTSLASLTVPFPRPDHDRSDVELRRLRVAWGMVGSVTEHIWQAHDQPVPAVDQRWTELWEELTNHLETSPQVMTTVIEQWTTPSARLPKALDAYVPRFFVFPSIV